MMLGLWAGKGLATRWWTTKVGAPAVAGAAQLWSGTGRRRLLSTKDGEDASEVAAQEGWGNEASTLKPAVVNEEIRRTIWGKELEKVMGADVFEMFVEEVVRTSAREGTGRATMRGLMYYITNYPNITFCNPSHTLLAKLPRDRATKAYFAAYKTLRLRERQKLFQSVLLHARAGIVPRLVEAALQHCPNGLRLVVYMRGDLIQLRDRLKIHQAEYSDLDNVLRSKIVPFMGSAGTFVHRVSEDMPENLLTRIMTADGVHPCTSLDELKLRLTGNRRCFAIFSHVLKGQPLAFVHVAFANGLLRQIGPIRDRAEGEPVIGKPEAAIFYSINNAETGTQGMLVGNTLLLDTVRRLQEMHPSIKLFSTLSPIPAFAKWFEGQSDDAIELALGPSLIAEVKALDHTEMSIGAILRAKLANPKWFENRELSEELRRPMLKLAGHYVADTRHKLRPGALACNVANFHLNNGARIAKINWLADTNERSILKSFGMMVNYRYVPSEMDLNRYEYINLRQIQVDAAYLDQMDEPWPTGTDPAQ